MGLKQYIVNEIVQDDRPERSRDSVLTLEEGGTKLTIRFFWSTMSPATAEGGWMLDIKDDQGDPLVLGIGLVLSQDVFKGYRYLSGIPDGQLFAFDTSLTGVEPGLRDFIDGRVQMLYRPAAEVVS